MGVVEMVEEELGREVTGYSEAQMVKIADSKEGKKLAYKIREREKDVLDKI